MRFYNIIYQKYRLVGLALLCILFTVNIVAQEAPKVDVTFKITGENDAPVPDAKVVVGEGLLHLTPGPDGSVSFLAAIDDMVTISAKGYVTSVVAAGNLQKNNVLKLEKAILYMSNDDNVRLPFVTLKKRRLTGSTSVVDGSLLNSYPTTDIRNSLTGLATGMEVVERNGSPGLHAEEGAGRYNAIDKVQLYSRGRPLMYMVDGIPVEITQVIIDPEEIESVSIIKDVSVKAMFGPAAADGIVYITTKRGAKNERLLNVNLESGVSMVDRMPEWVSGADYARLNNQARVNSGLPVKYSDSDIAAYEVGDPYDKYHPSIDFRKMMLKNTMDFRRANISSTGGNNAVQYYSYLGYSGEGDIYKIGPTADYNRINTRSNVDIRINDMLKVRFDFYGGLNLRRSANYGYDSDFTSDDFATNTAQNIHEFNSVISDITTVPPVAYPLYAAVDPVSGAPWYGVSQSYGYNPVGNIEGNGYYTEKTRIGASNVALEYDMGHMIKGLKSTTYLGINILNLTRLGQAEDYIAYVATPAKTVAGNDTILLSRSRAGSQMTGMAKLHDFYAHNYSVYQSFSYDRTFGNHSIQSTLTYYLSKVTLNDTEEPQRTQNGVWMGNYSFKNKYILQGVMNYAGTYSFDKGKRYALFPSGGAAWVISEEGFMQNMKFINYLKLRAEGGVIGYESFLPPFYYRDRWNVNTSGTAFGPVSTSTRWFGTTTDNTVYRTSPSRIGNPDLTWEKRKEFSVGFDALMMNEKLGLEVTYYNNLRDGIVSQLQNTLPYTVGISNARPWYNYNKVRYTGVEIGLNYSDKAGDFSYYVGGSAAYQTDEILKYDVPNYRFPYQSRVGQSISTIWGQTYLGKFASDAETLEVPQLYDETLKAGDLKYKDMNGDGVVDDNDQSAIGNNFPKLIYSLNVRLSYKNFDLTIIGTGRAFYDLALTTKYFWNGWQDNTYSKFVMDNIGGDYPRLTYNKVNNNFVNSGFWLRDGGFFKIQNVELAYNIKARSLTKINSRGIRIFARGANLLTISKIKDVDPEFIQSGVADYPLFITLTGGIKLTF